MKDIIKNIAASIISAILITVIFALWSDSKLKEYDLTGHWTLKATTQKTSLKAFENMELFYYVQIIQSSDNIVLRAEKIKEKTIVGGIKEYYGKNRTYVKCEGRKKYNYFSKNKLVLNCEEVGKIRKSTIILDLKINTENKIIGSFISSVANSSGVIEINRKTKANKTE